MWFRHRDAENPNRMNDPRQAKRVEKLLEEKKKGGEDRKE